jgi:hypothetical protein
MLSEYFPPIRGTGVDTPCMSTTQGFPEAPCSTSGARIHEPATSLSAYVMMENLKVEKGRVFVCPHANRSAATVGMLGNAYPKFLHVETRSGRRPTDRRRNTSPLDQWPDPFTYFTTRRGRTSTTRTRAT